MLFNSCTFPHFIQQKHTTHLTWKHSSIWFGHFSEQSWIDKGQRRGKPIVTQFYGRLEEMWSSMLTWASEIVPRITRSIVGSDSEGERKIIEASFPVNFKRSPPDGELFQISCMTIRWPNIELL